MNEGVGLIWRKWTDLSVLEFHAAIALRERVFIVEQNCAYQDVDGRDPQAEHLLAWEGSALLGYLRVFRRGDRYEDAACIGRVVVAPEGRGRGVARRMMEDAIAHLAADPIRISAQAYLEEFYRSLGFVTQRGPYPEDGIPHYEMWLPGH
jgi:ElaA protein